MQARRLANQRRIKGVLWVPYLAITRWTANSAGTAASVASENVRNSTQRWRRCSWPSTWWVFTSLNVSRRCGGNPKASQMRLIVTRLRPVA
jgi:hypothetical protein